MKPLVLVDSVAVPSRLTPGSTGWLLQVLAPFTCRRAACWLLRGALTGVCMGVAHATASAASLSVMRVCCSTNCCALNCETMTFSRAALPRRGFRTGPRPGGAFRRPARLAWQDSSRSSPGMTASELPGAMCTVESDACTACAFRRRGFPCRPRDELGTSFVTRHVPARTGDTMSSTALFE